MIRERLVGTWAGDALMALRERAKLYKTALLHPEQFCCIYNDQLASRLTASLCEGSFIDIGAHIGSSTAAVLKRHPSAKVIAIEAIPEKAAWLRRKFPSIDVRECAVADRRSRATFYVDIDRSGYSSLLTSRANGQDARRSIEVEVWPLDQLLPEDRVGLVKIDVEGAEYSVLHGASDFTARCRPVFVFESGPWAQAEQIWKWFFERDYAIFPPSRVAHEDDGMSLPSFLEGHRYPMLSMNYVAIPLEKREEVARRARGIADIWVSHEAAIPTGVGLEGLNFDGSAVLDIGCGTGKDLLHPAYSKALERCGIDPSEDHIGYGRKHYPSINLVVGRAESLPYEAERFDFVVSRVALVFTNIPVALAEISRVMKPGGRLLLTMHDWRMEMKRLWGEVRALSLRGLVRHAYVLIATAGYVMTGRVLPHPWAPVRECFQTRSSLERSLVRAGFQMLLSSRCGPHWVVEAVKHSRKIAMAEQSDHLQPQRMQA